MINQLNCILYKENTNQPISKKMTKQLKIVYLKPWLSHTFESPPPPPLLDFIPHLGSGLYPPPGLVNKLATLSLYKKSFINKNIVNKIKSIY